MSRSNVFTWQRNRDSFSQSASCNRLRRAACASVFTELSSDLSQRTNFGQIVQLSVYLCDDWRPIGASFACCGVVCVCVTIVCTIRNLHKFYTYSYTFLSICTQPFDVCTLGLLLLHPEQRVCHACTRKTGLTCLCAPCTNRSVLIQFGGRWLSKSWFKSYHIWEHLQQKYV